MKIEKEKVLGYWRQSPHVADRSKCYEANNRRVAKVGLTRREELSFSTKSITVTFF